MKDTSRRSKEYALSNDSYSQLMCSPAHLLSPLPTNPPEDSHQYRCIELTASKGEELHRKSLSSLANIPLPLERQTELDVWLQEKHTSSMAKAMKRYTPLPVRSAAIMENAGMLGEIRRATVMFVSIESDFLRKGTIFQRLERLQKIFEILQDNVITYRGIVKEFSVDDKGLVLVSGFGIPPHVGLTPPTRACLCSIALMKVRLEKSKKQLGSPTILTHKRNPWLLAGVAIVRSRGLHWNYHRICLRRECGKPDKKGVCHGRRHCQPRGKAHGCRQKTH